MIALQRRAHFLIYVICVCWCVAVSNTCCVLCFAVFVFALCFVYPMLPVSLDCPFLIAPSVFSNIYLFSFVLCLVYPMLPVSLDCPFLIASSVFPNVYITERNIFIKRRTLLDIIAGIVSPTAGYHQYLRGGTPFRNHTRVPRGRIWGFRKERRN